MFPAEIWTLIAEKVVAGGIVDALPCLTALACCSTMLRDVVRGLEAKVKNICAVLAEGAAWMPLQVPGLGELRRRRLMLVQPKMVRLPLVDVVTFSRKGGYVKKYSSVKLTKREALVLDREGDQVSLVSPLPERWKEYALRFAIGGTRHPDVVYCDHVFGQLFVQDGELKFSTVRGIVYLVQLTQEMLDEWPGPPDGIDGIFAHLYLHHGYQHLVIQVGTRFSTRDMTVIHVEKWGQLERAAPEKRKLIMEQRGRVVRQRLEAAASAAQAAYPALSTKQMMKLDHLVLQLEAIGKQQ
jgi:hypothetical protein